MLTWLQSQALHGAALLLQSSLVWHTKGYQSDTLLLNVCDAVKGGGMFCVVSMWKVLHSMLDFHWRTQLVQLLSIPNVLSGLDWDESELPAV